MSSPSPDPKPETTPEETPVESSETQDGPPPAISSPEEETAEGGLVAGRASASPKPSSPSGGKSPKIRGPVRPSKLPLIIVFLSVSIDMLGLSIILPVLPFLALEFDAEPYLVGLLFTAYAGAQALASTITGRMSDKFGRRPMIIASLFGSTVGFLCQGLSQNITQLLLARVLAGLFGSSVPIANATVADLTSRQERPKYLAALGAVAATSFLAGPSIGAGLSELSLRAPMFVASVLAGGGLILAAARLRETRQKTRGRSRTGSSVGADEDGDGAGKSGSGHGHRHRSKFLLPILFAIQFLVMSSFSAFLAVIGLYVEEKFNYNALRAGFLMSGTSLVFISTQMAVFPSLFRKLGGVSTAACGAALMAGGYAFLAEPNKDQIVLLAVCVFFMAAGYGLIAPSLTALTSAASSSANQGKNLGALMSFDALARVVGPAVWGGLFEESPAAPFRAAAGVAGLAFLLALSLKLIMKPAPKPVPQQATSSAAAPSDGADDKTGEGGDQQEIELVNVHDVEIGAAATPFTSFLDTVNMEAEALLATVTSTAGDGEEKEAEESKTDADAPAGEDFEGVPGTLKLGVLLRRVMAKHGQQVASQEDLGTVYAVLEDALAGTIDAPAALDPRAAIQQEAELEDLMETMGGQARALSH